MVLLKNNMKKTICFSFFLCIIPIAVTSICNYNERINYYSESENNFLGAVCENVTSDLALDFDHPNATLTEELTIGAGSKIPVIPAKSSLQKFPHLRELNLENVGIEQILPGAFDGLENLKKLELSTNNIKEISPGIFNNLHELERLSLEQNVLTTISEGVFSNLKNLEVLDLSENLISHIDEDSFLDLVSVKRLYLSENNLTVLPEGLFRNMNNLTTIWLGKNPLMKINNLAFGSKIDWISIGETDVKEFCLNLTQYTVDRVDVSEGYLEEIDFALFGVNVASVDFSQNRITTIKNINMASVKRIYISENNITELEALPERTTDLYLGKNQIKTITPVSDPSKYVMEALDLASNEITVASCFGLASLETLNLANNKISIIQKDSFVGCTNLSTLYLFDNKIEAIEPDAFSAAVLLSRIELSDNNLKTLSPDSFTNLNQLATFYFDNNHITSIDLASFVKISPELKFLKIANPFPCEELNKIFEKLKWYHMSVEDVSYIDYDKCSAYN